MIEHKKKSKGQIRREMKIKEEMKITVEELENLEYYDFMSYFNIPFFVIGGLYSSRRLATLCGLNESKKLLIVGCGQGSTAVMYAKDFKSQIIGVDIAEHMLEKAKRLSEKEGVNDKLSFQYGNAYELPFESESYDVIITEFVSQFLDLEKAFKEFARVLKPNGIIGLNEMYKEEEIPQKRQRFLEMGIENLIEVTGLSFHLNPVSIWTEKLKNNSFGNIIIEKISGKMSIKEAVREIGGWKSILKIIGLIIRLLRSSEIIKKRILTIGKGKKFLLRKRFAGKYVGYVLISAKKQ